MKDWKDILYDKMTIDEFEECEYHTSEDWANFLENGSYYIA